MHHRQSKGISRRASRSGEVVLMCEELALKGTWRIGRIVRKLPEEGAVRTATVVCANEKEITALMNLLVPRELFKAWQMWQAERKKGAPVIINCGILELYSDRQFRHVCAQT